MTHEGREFVVVGGWLLGMAVAAAMTQRGRQVTVLDQATLGCPVRPWGSCRISGLATLTRERRVRMRAP